MKLKCIRILVCKQVVASFDLFSAFMLFVINCVQLHTHQGYIYPIFWAVYADPILQRLRNLGLGAHIAGLFVGAVCYADDVLLIALSRSAMQRMLLEMEVFAEESNIMFSTNPIPSKSKSKCIFVVGKRNNLVKPAPLLLCGRELPFVAQADHLGNVLSERGCCCEESKVHPICCRNQGNVWVGCSSRSAQSNQDSLHSILWL